MPLPGRGFGPLSSSPIHHSPRPNSALRGPDSILRGVQTPNDTAELLARIAALEQNQRNSLPTNRGRTPMDLRGLAPRSETGISALRLNTGQRPPLQDTPAATTNIERRKIKCAPPSIFTGPPMDVRLWIIDLNDFFNLQAIEGSDIQASTACTYLGAKIKTRTQLMRLSGQRDIFENWETLQGWLLENYSVGDVKLDAELKMDRIRMRWNESVQDFINRFETLVTDLSWNDAAVCHAFRKKLTPEILDRVHQASAELPDTFASFKRAVQQAESHIKIGKRTMEDREEWGRQKRVRFTDQQGQQGTPQRLDFTRTGPPQGPQGGNPFPISSPNSSKMADITPEERKRRRDNKLCMCCAQPGHWRKTCPNEPKNVRP